MVRIMVDKSEVVTAMQELSLALNKSHGGTELAKYVSDSLIEIEKSEGAAFTGSFQYFMNRAPILKFSEGIKFNENERTLWRKVFSFTELGNNLFRI